jgi:hypothetical protein
MAQAKAKEEAAATAVEVVHFRSRLVPHPKMEAGWIELSPAVHRKLGGAGRIPVRGRINGGPEFRTTACRMGGPMFFVVNRQVREASGVRPGDRVDVELSQDREKRTVAVPRDLAAALSKAKLRKVFDAMSFTHRKEWALAVTEAKKPETRQRRIEKCVAAVGERAGESVAKR